MTWTVYGTHLQGGRVVGLATEIKDINRLKAVLRIGIRDRLAYPIL